jgi:hypothetical protein
MLLEWIGHAVRMEHGMRVKKISEGKPEWRRRIGRQRLRRLEDVEKDLREMKGKRWRQKAVHRAEWPSVIKQVKALRWPYRYLRCM